MDGPARRVELLILSAELLRYCPHARFDPTRRFEEAVQWNATTVMGMTVQGTAEFVRWVLSMVTTCSAAANGAARGGQGTG